MVKTMRKAQFKIQQMTFMIAAVFLFFVLAGLFLLGVQFKNLRKQADVIARNQAMAIAEFLAESPEFRCGGSLGSYCIDTDKIVFMMNRQAYNEFWPVAYIKVYKAYPQNTITCTQENYPECGVFNIFDSGASSTTSVQSFVALCRKDKTEVVSDVCELGRFVIGYKVK